jgi:hypothetical protein
MRRAVGFVPWDGDCVLTAVAACSLCGTIEILVTQLILDKEKWRESYRSSNHAGGQMARRDEERREVVRDYSRKFVWRTHGEL